MWLNAAGIAIRIGLDRRAAMAVGGAPWSSSRPSISPSKRRRRRAVADERRNPSRSATEQSCAASRAGDRTAWRRRHLLSAKRQYRPAATCQARFRHLQAATPGHSVPGAVRACARSRWSHRSAGTEGRLRQRSTCRRSRPPTGQARGPALARYTWAREFLKKCT